MSREHQHHHHHDLTGKNLSITLVLNAGISLAELLGGLISGSMALISDAIHNFSDVLSLVVSYIAQGLAKKDAGERSTFGYRRSEILAALVNSTTLIILALYIFYQAILRLREPQSIDSFWVISLAALSIVVNAGSVLLIKKSAKHSMNIKSAYLHLLGDMLTSIGVLAGGLIIKFFQVYWIDTLFSALIAIYLLNISQGIFRSSLKIMMQFTPEGLDINEVVAVMNQIEGVKNVHHVHLWQINEHDIMLEAHIDFEEDIRLTYFEKTLKSIEERLSVFHIHHITIQPEYSRCEDKRLLGH